MPSIDDFIKFKKRTFRSWDNDLLANLTINTENADENITSIKEISKPNLSQTEAKLEPKKRQIKAKLESNDSQVQVNRKPEIESKSESILSQSEDTKKFDNSSFLSLVGLQKRLAIYIYELCKYQRSKTTMPLSIENAAVQAETTVSSARKALQRMEQKGILIRIQSKAGRGGWTRYELNKDIHDEINHYNNLGSSKIDFNYLSQTEAKFESKIKSEFKPNFSSSSSLNKLTTNTETVDSSASMSKNSLPQEWLDIDITPLESTGFNLNKLQQIYQAGKLTPEMVQDSIYAYAFDIEFNLVKHNSPINFIMSQLKVKGIPYEFPPNYESPQDRALRRYLEQKKAQRERSQQLHELLKQEAFEEWLKNLPEEEQEKLVPSHQYAPGTNLRRAALVTHYNKHIWPEKEKTVLAMVTK